MERFSYGLTQHTCEALGRAIFLPLGLEKYNSKVVATARCQICGKLEFEVSVDKSYAPARASYMTV